MKKEIMLLLILILTTTVTAQVPTYQLETILPSPHCTSVDLSPDGTKLCARMQYGSWDEGYREFDAHTYEVVEDHHPLGSAPWRGLISADNQYLWHTVYYGGKVEKLDLSTKNIIVKSLDVGSWTYGLAFDSSRRFLYVGENCPGTGALGSLKVIDTGIETVVGSVTLNGEPGFHIVVDSLDEFVYIMSKNSGTETLYKIRTSDYGVDTLSLPGVGESGISISQNGANVYVPHPAADLVYIIDTGTMTVSGSWSIPSVVGFFVSPDGTHALVVGSSPDIRVFDLLTEAVVQTISIPDIGTSFGPGKSIPYWDENNGKVYINLSSTMGGVAVLVPEPGPLTGRIAFISVTEPGTWHGGGKLCLINGDGTGRYEVPLPYEQYPQVTTPQWSYDGDWITLCASDQPHHGQIFVVRPDGTGFRRVTDGSGSQTWPSFSPDGSMIEYHPSYGHLYTINFDGSGRTQHPPLVSHSRWSPDGRYVVYSNWGFTYDSDLFLYDFTKGQSTQITHHKPGQAYILAAWSPDGKKLAADVLDRNQTDKNDIWIMDADGSNQINFTAAWPNSHELRASWSGDGKYLVFLSTISGNQDIWYSPIDHFEPVNITNSPEDEAEPVIMMAEPAEPEWTFVHLTDPHIGYKYKEKKDKDKTTEDLDAAISQIVNMTKKPDFILVTGDIAHYGCDEESNCHSHYNRFLEAIQNAVDEGIKIYAIPGNHDRLKWPIERPIDVEEYCICRLCCYNEHIHAYLPEGTTDLIPGSSLLRDYYFNHKELMFVGLDSGSGFPHGEGLFIDQIDALNNLSVLTPKIAFMHHPGVDEWESLTDWDVDIENNQDEFIEWCASSNVQLVLSGHSHQDRIYDKDGGELDLSYPWFIQTPSTVKRGIIEYLLHDPAGYRLVDVRGGVAYPQEYTRTKDRNKITTSLSSPANVHVYDSAGRHVGVVDGNEAEKGIPDSFYHSHYVVETEDSNEVFPEKIIIFDPNDEYMYRVVGRDTGKYRLQIISTEDGNDMVFDANDIPTLSGSVHTYMIDWNALSQGQNGVTVTVDVDGDGDPEKTIISDNVLTSDEFDTPPIANAGGPYMEQATSWLGASVDLDGTESSDPDGDEITYEWDLDLSVDSDGDGDPNNDVDAIGPTHEAFFYIGQTKIALVVVDEYGVRSEPDTTTVTVSVIEVGIDIKPGSLSNAINLGSHGVIPVAFLSDSGFDASTIDPATVTLRGEDFTDGLVKLRGKKDAPVPMSNLEDVDEDGDLDLVVHLVTEQLAEYELEAICELGALTYEGYVVSGSDTIRVVPE